MIKATKVNINKGMIQINWDLQTKYNIVSSKPSDVNTPRTLYDLNGVVGYNDGWSKNNKFLKKFN